MYNIIEIFCIFWLQMAKNLLKIEIGLKFSLTCHKIKQQNPSFSKISHQIFLKLCIQLNIYLKYQNYIKTIRKTLWVDASIWPWCDLLLDMYSTQISIKESINHNFLWLWTVFVLLVNMLIEKISPHRSVVHYIYSIG